LRFEPEAPRLIGPGEKATARVLVLQHHAAKPNRLLAAALGVACAVSAGALLWASGWFRAKPVALGAARFQIAFVEIRHVFQ